MTDVNQTPDTNPAAEADQPANTGANTNSQECRWSHCRPFGGQGWQGHCRKKKAIIGIFLVALLAFFAGRGCSHHHEHWQMGHAGQPAVTQSFNGEVQQMPLSTVLDGIAATPEQRAKAVDLLH